MGETTFGKYRLLAELGHGGMADVFLAVQAGPAGSGFRKLTVVKRLRPNLAEEPEFIAMLVDEARIAARLNHPNVVQTNEVGEVGNLYFIAMEYLDGQPMHRIQYRAMQRQKNGEPPLLTKEHQYLIVADSLAGLHHAHELADYDGTPLGIVHRDITPHNIFVTYEGSVKVVDFGIAKAVGRASETRAGVVKGKVRYMAPEQAIGQAVDRRADIFSAGVMLWEAATGRRLWKDMDDMQIVQALVVGDYPASPRLVDPTVPEMMDRICAKALAPKASDRYETSEDFRTDIEQFLAETGKLVETRRKLGPVVSELFSDKRAQIKQVIEKQIAALDTKESGEFKAVTIPVDTTSNPGIPGGSEDRSLSGASAATSMQPTQAPPRSQLGARIGIGVAAAASVAVVAVVMSMNKPAPAVQNNDTTSAPIAKPEAPKNEELMILLSATPGHARVSIDDGPLRGLPYEGRVLRDDKEHKIRVEADGYVAQVKTVKFNGTIAEGFTLEKIEKKTNTPPQQVIVVRQGGTPTAAPKPDPATKPEPTTTTTTTAAPTSTIKKPKLDDIPELGGGK